ncbi:MAG: hypothetical protein AAGC70_12180 [Pseudomonadota bacterium]
MVVTGTGTFMVRAVVADPADRPDFDAWYQDEHLPDAVAKFSALRAWRCWSETDPSVHFAFYEFADVAAASAIQDSAALKGLVADFDARWGDRVTRSRDVLNCVGTLQTT